jgi:hypothetical protein
MPALDPGPIAAVGFALVMLAFFVITLLEKAPMNRPQLTQDPLPVFEQGRPADLCWTLWIKGGSHWRWVAAGTKGWCTSGGKMQDMEHVILPPGETPLMERGKCHKKLRTET